MEKSLKKWEEFALIIIWAGLPFLLQMYALETKQYLIGEPIQPNKTLILTLYLLYFLIIIVLDVVIRKIVEHRIKGLDMKLIYSPDSKKDKFALIGTIIVSIVYIVAMIFVLKLIMLMTVALFYTIHYMLTENKVYEASDAFIMDGIKYQHKNISEWDFSHMYRIYCKIDVKNRVISCKSRARYNFMELYFQKHLLDE